MIYASIDDDAEPLSQIDPAVSFLRPCGFTLTPTLSDISGSEISNSCLAPCLLVPLLTSAQNMSYADIRKFEALTRRILAEREAIKARLAEIEEAIGRRPVPSNNPRMRRRKDGGMTMREALILALQAGPLKLKHMVPAMQEAGYVFTSSNPKNSLGSYLYGPQGRKHFTRSMQGFIVR